jgi:hypothetical protein
MGEKTVYSPYTTEGNKRSGPRTGVSILSDSSRPRGKGRVHADQYLRNSPPPVQGQADPVPGGPMIGPGEPRGPADRGW